MLHNGLYFYLNTDVFRGISPSQGLTRTPTPTKIGFTLRTAVFLGATGDVYCDVFIKIVFSITMDAHRETRKRDPTLLAN
jgi:hypothetical protein